jgi:hypothetical protein
MLLVVAACGSGKAKVEDSRPAPPVVQMHVSDAPPAPASGAGDVSIRAEWNGVPAALRASPGRTPCGTAVRAQVAPTVTWGIPDAFVTLSGERAKPAPDPGAKLVLDHCAPSPRALLSGDKLAITSTATQPAQVTVHRFDKDGKAPAKPVFLPIAGHEVDVPLEAGGWYEIAAGDESAWVFATQKLYAGVTDATGVVVLRDVPAGTYTVTAWFPPYAHGHPYGGQKQVTVTAGALAEVTVDLGPWAGTSP